MRFQSSLSTYSHDSQRKKKNQSQRDCKSLKERKNYYDSFNLFNPEGTIHLLLKGDILTSYEQPLNNRLFLAYSTVTDLARFRGWSTSRLFNTAT